MNMVLQALLTAVFTVGLYELVLWIMYKHQTKNLESQIVFIESKDDMIFDIKPKTKSDESLH